MASPQAARNFDSETALNSESGPQGGDARSVYPEPGQSPRFNEHGAFDHHPTGQAPFVSASDMHQDGDAYWDVQGTPMLQRRHSPSIVLDSGHLSPYGGHLSDTAYGDFSTPSFGDELSENITDMLSLEDEFAVTATQEDAGIHRVMSAGTPVTLVEGQVMSNGGDSIRHPSTSLLSPVPTGTPSPVPGNLQVPAQLGRQGWTHAEQATVSPQDAVLRPSSRSTDVGPASNMRSPAETLAETDEQHYSQIMQPQLGSFQMAGASYLATPGRAVTASSSVAAQPSSTSASSLSNSNLDGNNIALDPSFDENEDDDDDDESARPRRGGIGPIDRARMNTTAVPSLTDQENERALAETKAGVEKWLTNTESNGLTPNADKEMHAQSKDPSVTGLGVYVDSREPRNGNPGMDNISPDRIEVDDTTPPAPVNGTIHTSTEESFPTPSEPPSTYSLLQGQRPWVDSPFDPETASIKGQPSSSSAAMERFERRARDIETASRTATIASSRRRRSLESLVSAAGIRVLVPTSVGDGGARSDRRRSSFLGRMMPGRSSSNVRKRKDSDESQHSNTAQEKRRSPSPIPRPLSFNRSRGLEVGPNDGATLAPHSPKSPATLSASGPWVNRVLGRNRSRSDLGQTSALAQKWAAQGGPPLLNLRPQSADVEHIAPVNETRDRLSDRPDSDVDAEGEDDHTPTEMVDMAMDPMSSLPNPTPEGFKSHAQKVNPRMEPFMLDRVVNEQLKRYRKLIDSRIKHADHVRAKYCPSQKCCNVLGSGARPLSPRKGSGNADTPAVTFHILRNGVINDGEDFEGDDLSQPASFPDGIPIPPVDKLPAEFECPLCFQVKQIWKPSDWTKHVHEDLQPFTCSFPDCGEPKSFKRKADWVRHENERHRQLEKWICDTPDCGHVCFRKDNFVQHLVREHKHPEPRVRSARSGRSAPQETGAVAQLVEKCRKETQKRPEQEPCRFCGAVCTSWKKLTVHLAKHMEHISLPILKLADQRNFSTLAEPFEQERGYNERLDDITTANHTSHQRSLTEDPFGQRGLVNTVEGFLDPNRHAPQNVTNFDGSGYQDLRRYSSNETDVADTAPKIQSYSFPGTKNMQRVPSQYEALVPDASQLSGANLYPANPQATAGAPYMSTQDPFNHPAVSMAATNQAAASMPNPLYVQPAANQLRPYPQFQQPNVFGNEFTASPTIGDGYGQEEFPTHQGYGFAASLSHSPHSEYPASSSSSLSYTIYPQHDIRDQYPSYSQHIHSYPPAGGVAYHAQTNLNHQQVNLSQQQKQQQQFSNFYQRS